MVTLAEAATENHAMTIAFGILGAIYGFVAISVLMCIVLPRIIAAQAASAIVQAARPTAVGASRVVGAAARPSGPRWSPAYNGGHAARTQPGAYVPPRNEIELQPMSRLPAAANRRFPPINRVSLRLCIACTHKLQLKRAPAYPHQQRSNTNTVGGPGWGTGVRGLARGLATLPQGAPRSL